MKSKIFIEVDGDVFERLVRQYQNAYEHLKDLPCESENEAVWVRFDQMHKRICNVLRLINNATRPNGESAYFKAWNANTAFDDVPSVFGELTESDYF